MRPTMIAAALVLATFGNAFAQEAECTTTTTTTTTCKGSAAPLAAPGAEVPQQPVYQQPVYPQPTPQPYYAAPPPVMYQPQLMPPLKSHTEERSRTGLMAAGAAVFGGLYLMNAMIGYAAGEGRLAIPIVGPLMIANFNGDSGNRFGAMMAMFDALVQSAGVVMFIAGAVTKKTVTVYDKVAISPVVMPNGGGLAAMGQF